LGSRKTQKIGGRGGFDANRLQESRRRGGEGGLRFCPTVKRRARGQFAAPAPIIRRPMMQGEDVAVSAVLHHGD